jgi:hypothetical protein
VDTTLGGALTSAQSIQFQGKLDVLQNLPGAQAVTLGYASTTRSDLFGLSFFSQAGEPNWAVLGQVQQATGTSVTRFAEAGDGPTRNVLPGDRTFSFSYDPTGGNGNGRIVASVSGAGDPVTLDLTAGARASFDAARFDAFGIKYTQLVPPSNTFVTDYRFDDLTYTALPEPQIAALALAGLLILRRGRQGGFGRAVACHPQSQRGRAASAGDKIQCRPEAGGSDLRNPVRESVRVMSYGARTAGRV